MGLSCIMPNIVLEALNDLINFNMSQQCFICDKFVVAMK
jgi:hypothetical protein